MPKWDGKIRKEKEIFDHGRWTKRKRCCAIVQSSGAGYSGTHQCSLTVEAEYNGKPLCWTHLRKELRK